MQGVLNDHCNAEIFAKLLRNKTYYYLQTRHLLKIHRKQPMDAPCLSAEKFKIPLETLHTSEKLDILSEHLDT